MRSRFNMSTQNRTLKKGPVHWILDWDGTITKKDTLDALVNIAASAKPTFPTQERWKSVVDAYMSDYSATLEKFVPNGVLPTTIEEESQLLRDLKVVEQRSLDRVFESKIFERVTRETLEKGATKATEAGEVALRPGCVVLLQSVLALKDDKLHVLSVNWSRHFISSCLKANGAELDSDLIFANELDGIAEGEPSTGQISPDDHIKIISSGDKLRYLERMREENPAPIVYVGDSWTDIECLLAADLGICIRNEPMGSSQKKLAEALERLGVMCPHILDQSGAAQSQIVWAKDFTEISKWMKDRRV
jgi:phosphoglycolate phosphatase-like HAD superfamily hydrolase